MSNLRPVSRAEQEKMGLVRVQRPANYVPALPSQRTQLPAQSATTYTIDAQPSAQLGSVTHTSATDKATAFRMIMWPLATILGVLILAVMKSLAGFPLLSMATFLTFWVTFAFTWLIGWGITLLMSAEGVALFEAAQKWKIVGNEQKERWAFYREQNAQPQPEPQAPKQGIDWPLVLYVTGALWAMVLITWLVVG